MSAQWGGAVNKQDDLGEEPKMQGRFSNQQKVGSKVPLSSERVSFVQKMLGRKHECTGACTHMCTHAHTVTLR